MTAGAAAPGNSSKSIKGEKAPRKRRRLNKDAGASQQSAPAPKAIGGDVKRKSHQRREASFQHRKSMMANGTMGHEDEDAVSSMMTILQMSMMEANSAMTMLTMMHTNNMMMTSMMQANTMAMTTALAIFWTQNEWMRRRRRMQEMVLLTILLLIEGGYVDIDDESDDDSDAEDSERFDGEEDEDEHDNEDVDEIHGIHRDGYSSWSTTEE